MIRTDLGAVTAYAAAVAKGYTGTETQFEEDMAALSDNASKLNTLYPADTTLAITGKAADAKTVGDQLTLVKQDIANVGGILGTNISTLNLESGSIDLTTGSNVVNASRVRSAGYLEVSPNTGYTMSFDTAETGYMWVVGYDVNKAVISDGNVGGYASSIGHLNNANNGGDFTTSATTKYIRWYNTANIGISTSVKVDCSKSWKVDADNRFQIKSKDRMILVTGSTPVITEQKNSQIVVSFPSAANIYCIKDNGAEYKRFDVSAGTSYTLTSNQVLIWDLTANTVSVVGNNTTRSNCVLLLNNYNGKASKGELFEWVIRSRPLVRNINTTKSKYAQVSSSITTQGLTIVKDKIWGFDASNDDHSNYGYITVKNINTFAEDTSIRHNLGHCASADYNVNTDTVITCNGSSDRTVLPELYLIKGASSYNTSSSETIAYNDTTQVIKIDAHTLDGSGLVGCFGESDNIVYLATLLTNNETRIYKCILGMGAVDYSSVGYGTFISGVGNNEYNGTMKLLNIYSGVPLDVYQGICFYNGYLYLCLDSSARKEAKIQKISLYNETYYEIIDEYMVSEYDTSGDVVYYEPEGLCVYKGIYFLLNLAKTGNNKMVLIPIDSKQGGTGNVGTAITFPVVCNNVPIVTITPLSATTDLYISSISNTGFTVASASNGTGQFNWICNIS